MIRLLSIAWVVPALCACGDDGGGGDADSDVDTDTDSDTDADTDSGTGTGTGTGTGDPDRIEGELLEGAGGWTLPQQCEVRFYEPADVDPDTGEILGDQFTTADGIVGVRIESFPAPYGLTPSAAEGYVGLFCSTDDDPLTYEAGGWYPGLPAELVTAPATGIDITLATF